MPRLILTAVLVLALWGCGSDSGEKYLEEGFVYFQQQDFDRAIASYEKAISLGARSPGAYNMLGMAYRFKYQRVKDPGLQEMEIEAFQQAVKIDPKYWVAMVNLGNTYYSRGDKERAAYWFKKALELNANHPEKAQMEKMIAEGTPPPENVQKKGRSSERRRGN